MVKILMVSNMYSAYGAEKMLLWLGHSLAKDTNYNVEFVSLFDTARSNEVGENNVSYEFGISNSGSIFRRYHNYFFKGYKKFYSLFKDNSYDYVVSFGQHSFYLLLLLKKKFGFKLVVSERNDPYAGKRIWSIFKRIAYKLADNVVFQTDGARSFYNLCDPKKTYIIPNPVTIPMEKWTLESVNKSIINVARLEILTKRQDVLIKAFRIFLTRHSDYVLELCGDGRDRECLYRLVLDLGIQDKVIFHGKVSNINEYLSHSRLFVFTSDSEGLPNALMEAMALGMPVVSTKCRPGGAELLIRSGENGILVNRGDEVTLAQVMCNLVEDDMKSISLGEKARVSMADYDPLSIIAKWKIIFK